MTHDQTPAAFTAWPNRAASMYATNGCVYCHSQQVRSRAAQRGHRPRLGRAPHRGARLPAGPAAYLGESRLGRDLANVGTRRDKADWLYEHMYEPDVVTPGTICPPLRFLFDRRAIVGQPSTEAVKVEGPDAPDPSEEVVPGHDAKALAAYLLSLKRSSYKLPEAPEEAAEAP